jgi:hypothetical protein
MFTIACCIICSIWACISNTCSSVGGGGGLALLLSFVLIGGMVASVGYLIFVKRSEAEIAIEIKDFQLYASRYNDDCNFI